MSALEWSPPCALVSPSSSARIAAPFLEASIRSTSSESSMSPASRPASESVGCAADASGSIHVRYALATTPGFAPTAPCPS